MRGQPDLQHVFIYILCNCDPEGFADFVPGVIADDCGLPLERVEAAIMALCQPDPLSRSQELEGRRLEPLDDRGWGWRVVNHEFYKQLMDPDIRREQWRRSQKKRRSNLSTSVNNGHQSSAHTDVDTDADAKKKTLLSERKVRTREREAPGFAEFYEAYPKHEDRRDASRAFVAALKRHDHITAEELTWAAGEQAKDYRAEGKDVKYQKLPATWLNKGSYLSYLEDKADEKIPPVNGNVAALN